jgi:hypothetical protein
VSIRNRLRFVLRAARNASADTAEPIGRTISSRHERFSGGSSLLQGPWSRGGIWGGVDTVNLAPRVSREEALQVPAVLRGRNLIAGTVSSLPLRTINEKYKKIDNPLMRQINPQVPNVVTMAETVEDLVFEGVSWWRVTAFGWDDFPTNAEHLEFQRVSTSPPPGAPARLPSGVYPAGVVWVDGRETDGRKIIRFDSPLPPLLVHGARAIRRALRVERTAEMYADDPRMLGYFTASEGADPVDPDSEDEAVVDLLDDWSAARRSRATAWVPAWAQYHEANFMSPADLQLTQLQQRCALDIVNLMGLDAEDFGINVTSRTYANVTDRRQDRINETFGPFMRAITDRLSMNDVTKRNQQVIFWIDDFMKADPRTRADVAEKQINVGALTIDEYRADEGRPMLPPNSTPAAQPPPPVRRVESEPARVAAPPQDDGAGMSRHLGVVSFSDDLTGQQFTFEPDAIEFRADADRRTVSGVLLPFGPVGRNPRGRWRFAPGSLDWKRSAVSRVKLNREHDRSQLLGAATAIKETSEAVTASFKVARGPAGDQALSEAEDDILDGFSPEVDILDYTVDPADSDVFLVTKALLTGTALTATPAFDDARLTSVAASTHSEGTTVMTDATTGQTAPAAPAATPAAQFTADHVTAFTGAVEAFTGAVERLGEIPPEQRQVVNASRAQVREPLVYSLDGRGHSFVRDAWEVKRGSYGSTATADAFSRLKKYEEQTQALSTAAFNARLDAQFTGGDRTTQAEIIPPGYRPDLYVGQIPQGRPLFEAMSRGALSNATPFKVPVWVGATGMSGDNSEGTGPSDGTMTAHTYRTVTPTAQSGEFTITRELVDSANPAIDQIALAAMREEYAQDTEAVISTAIAGATDGTNTPVSGTSATSTEGCYMYAVTGTGNDLAAEIRYMEAEFPFHRYTVAPDRVLLSSQGWGGLVRAIDDVGRPLFPFAGAMNAYGTVGQSAQSMNIDGLPGIPAWALSTTYDDVVMFNHVDAWAWESGLLSFRFEEKAGPENIVLNIWGYFAFQILRYTGIHALRYTPA